MFRKLFTCLECSRTLIGEVHGRFIYYRCQNRDCPMTAIPENVLEQGFMDQLEKMQLTEREHEFFAKKVHALKADWAKERLSVVTLLESRVMALTERLGKLTDAFLDNTIEKEIYEERKRAILIERKSLEGKVAELQNGRSIPDELREFLEFTKGLKTLYETAFPDKRRRLVQTLTSKNLANKKSLVFGFKPPVNVLHDRVKVQYGSPSSDLDRNMESLWSELVAAFRNSTWTTI